MDKENVMNSKDIIRNIRKDKDTVEKFKEEVAGYKLYRIRQDNHVFKKFIKTIRKTCKNNEEYIEKCKRIFLQYHEKYTNGVVEFYIIVKIRAKFPIVLSEFEIDNPDKEVEYITSKGIVQDIKKYYKYRTSCIVIDDICDQCGNIIEIDNSLKQSLELKSPFYNYNLNAKFNKFIIANKLDMNTEKECSNGIHFFYDINSLLLYFEERDIY